MAFKKKFPEQRGEEKELFIIYTNLSFGCLSINFNT